MASRERSAGALDWLLAVLTEGASRRRPTSGDVVDQLAAAKIVRKGWGEERWLVAEGRPFGFKLIRIDAGSRTSLQYHQVKEEVNLVLGGSGILYHALGTDHPLTEHSLGVGDLVHIKPGIIHRISAITDLVMLEASSSELDDVIRLVDDWGRGSGRIPSEHEIP